MTTLGLHRHRVGLAQTTALGGRVQEVVLCLLRETFSPSSWHSTLPIRRRASSLSGPGVRVRVSDTKSISSMRIPVRRPAVPSLLEELEKRLAILHSSHQRQARRERFPGWSWVV